MDNISKATQLLIRAKALLQSSKELLEEEIQRLLDTLEETVPFEGPDENE